MEALSIVYIYIYPPVLRHSANSDEGFFMKLPDLLSLSGLFATTSFADITKADVTLHPFLPGTEPYLIEIDGF